MKLNMFLVIPNLKEKFSSSGEKNPHDFQAYSVGVGILNS